ncbi:MAG: SDR family NAD(P)-dependent oxidoreductase [Nanoarchaeota archaeon]|nr:SDR family NAD(P)-dependent oxidoreductase [Nanoarchaeota archaeon]MCG2718660.1 SDR family NAD(P)-dependent oxidoreductase [Nanoarchaeota archaeon]
MRVLVTGGAGFIGSHLAERLVEEGNEVVVLDNLDLYYNIKIKKKNIQIIREKGCKFVEGDVTDYKFVKNIIKDIDIIFHEAARPGVRASIKDPFTSNLVNVNGILNILKASVESNVKKVINASSSSVYGKVEYLPFDEKHPTQPLSPYGVSKLAAEHYCRVFYEIYGLPTVSLRYFTVYGPRMRPDLAIPIFTKSMLNNESVIIFGDGEQTRDFTYIDDIINANLNIMKTNRADGEVLNIGGEHYVTINYLVNTLKAMLGSNSHVIYNESVKGDARHTLANIDKAKQLIGYKPKVLLEDGLNRFVKWYKENKDFYEA